MKNNYRNKLRFIQNRRGVRSVILIILLLLSSLSLAADEIDDAWAEIVELYSFGRYEEVIAQATELFTLVTPFSDLYLIRGIAYRDTGYFAEAHEDFNAAIDLQPDNGYNFFHRGYAFLMENYYVDAVNDFSSALNLIPDMYEAYWNRGIAYNWISENKLSLKDLNKAIELIPQYNPYLFRDRAVVLNEMGLYEDALNDYSTAIDMYTDEPIFYAERGLVLQTLGNFAASIADLDTAILLRSTANADDYYNRGVSYAQLMQYDKAVSDFTESIRLQPGEVDALNNRAWSFIQLDRFAEAVTDCTAAIELDPDYPISYFNRAAALERLKNPEAAIADYRTAVELALKDETGQFETLVFNAQAAIEKLEE
ncbi:MAG: tetratricopeptide repeat protein [Spirochaetia bacterium]|nr:tetratricopeptide repeat protein [Spirochaetia bacterium]